MNSVHEQCPKSDSVIVLSPKTGSKLSRCTEHPTWPSQRTQAARALHQAARTRCRVTGLAGRVAARTQAPACCAARVVPRRATPCQVRLLCPHAPPMRLLAVPSAPARAPECPAPSGPRAPSAQHPRAPSAPAPHTQHPCIARPAPLRAQPYAQMGSSPFQVLHRFFFFFFISFQQLENTQKHIYIFFSQ